MWSSPSQAQLAQISLHAPSHFSAEMIAKACIDLLNFSYFLFTSSQSDDCTKNLF